MSNVTPQRITAEEFKEYSAAWKKLVNGPDASTLNSYFMAGSDLINYVYLPAELAQDLLDTKPTSIALEFALVPTDGTLSFTMLLAGLNQDNCPQAPYYQAGVAGRAALVIVPTAILGDPIPYSEAYEWITQWNKLNPDSLGTQQFESGSGQRLWAYDYDNADLEGALRSEPTPADAALWFNFVLHPETPIFSTVLTLNARPSATNPGIITLDRTLSYFDVSKPCPPFHIDELIDQQ
jgi:hypothetical protein